MHLEAVNMVNSLFQNIKARRVHLFVNMKEFKLEEGGTRRSGACSKKTGTRAWGCRQCRVERERERGFTINQAGLGLRKEGVGIGGGETLE